MFFPVGISLKDNKPLKFQSGINLIKGRNGGKTNLMRLVQFISGGLGDLLFASRQKEQAQRSIKHLTEHICISGESGGTKS